ncbi:receptor-like serine/threonine-protein kinase SD1-8 [Ziziphus jujuba]|uniref:Receptor-like serine/threonine-protein kinase SD1-8 n=1 Tax=Ziziphus jujuba TaxID=326968 RepID=A0ABM3I961_ZIZJJ|nr:receptor-like serine/threonine-protein kinase SD1-8 [Ziziphus jujuba]
MNQNNAGQTENLEVLLFDLDKIVKTANNFSRSNKLGEGGFRPFYRLHGNRICHMGGLFSVKSEVFSFVILLLIIIGKKNRGFYHLETSGNLIGYAWKLWKEGRPLELISPILSDSSNLSKELDSIHVGLLCVQEHPEDRSSMSYVVFMLGCDNALPEPKQPGFSLGKDNVAGDSSSNKLESSSTNEITVTLLELR